MSTTRLSLLPNPHLKYTSGLYYIKEDYVNADGTPIPGAFDGDSYYDSWSEVPRPFRCKARNASAQPGVAASFWVLFTLG